MVESFFKGRKPFMPRNRSCQETVNVLILLFELVSEKCTILNFEQIILLLA
jgi:hypothetical protein